MFNGDRVSVLQGPSLVAQLVKNPPAMQDTLVQFLGWEDPLEKGMTTYSNILACRTPWTPRLYIWTFLVHVLLKPHLMDFEHNLASM